MWDLPGLRIEPVSSALSDKFLTPDHQGSSLRGNLITTLWDSLSSEILISVSSSFYLGFYIFFGGTYSSIYAPLVAQRVKRLSAMQETWVQFLGQEDPLEKEMATHSSILAWRICGWRRLVGYSPRGCKELDTTEQIHFTSLHFIPLSTHFVLTFCACFYELGKTSPSLSLTGMVLCSSIPFEDCVCQEALAGQMELEWGIILVGSLEKLNAGSTWKDNCS